MRKYPHICLVGDINSGKSDLLAHLTGMTDIPRKPRGILTTISYKPADGYR